MAKFIVAALSPVVLALGIGLWLHSTQNDDVSAPTPLAERLSQTGLIGAGGPEHVDPAYLPFSPQYALWSDGASKRRWIGLPPGTKIDASDMNAWRFPVRTRFFKEFSIGSRRIETRLIERISDSEWRYATYRWLPDGSDAVLVSARGARAVAVSEGGTPYDLPSVSDCKACHEAARVPVLGFSALQLSSDRDPQALHALARAEGELDLTTLVKRKMLHGTPARWTDEQPRVAARTPNERAALGYLHGNCAHCHRQDDVLPDVDLDLEQRVGESVQRVLISMMAQSHKRLPGETVGRPRIVPGKPDGGLLLTRLASREPLLQMPPLGTRWRDDRALELLQNWVLEQHPMARQIGQ